MNLKRVFSPAMLLFVAALAIPPVMAASVSNLAREKAYADRAVEQLFVGEEVWLPAAGVRFLGLYAAPEGKNKQSTTAVLLIHGLGVHPSWGFIETLRTELVDAGFHTLSLQMPILSEDKNLADYDATLPEAFQRLDAGIDYLRGKGIKKTVLIGHSLGALTSLHYGAEREAAQISGIAALNSPSGPAASQYLQPERKLARIRYPILDVYGENDIEPALKGAATRGAIAKQAKMENYRQVKIAGANHFYAEQYEDLKSVILPWLVERKK